MQQAVLLDVNHWLGRAVSKTILFITNDFGPRAGGIETFVIGLIERRAFGTTIVYTSAQDESDNYDQEWLDKYGVQVIRDKAKILLPTPRVARKLSQIIKMQKITVAAFGAAAPLGLLSPWLKRSGIERTVALTHGHEVWWAKLFPFTLLMRIIGSSVDTLTYLGSFTQRAISKSVGARAANSMVKIAPGIDFEHFSPRDVSGLRKELGLKDKRVIVSVGRLVHRKGQDHLITSFPQILREVPNAHLLIIGQGPYLKELQKLVSKNNLKEYVTFIGRIFYDQLPNYICVGDVFAMPSRSRFFGLEVEGLGIVYLEASACGLPVIAGASGGAPDAVIENVTGVVVDGTNDLQIANAVIKLLQNDQESKQMGLSGRQWITDQWGWGIWSEKFEKLLHK